MVYGALKRGAVAGSAYFDRACHKEQGCGGPGTRFSQLSNFLSRWFEPLLLSICPSFQLSPLIGSTSCRYFSPEISLPLRKRGARRGLVARAKASGICRWNKDCVKTDPWEAASASKARKNVLGLLRV